MKYLIYALLSILTVGCLSSCSEEDPVRPYPQPAHRFYGIRDGAILTNIELSYKQSPNVGDGFKDFHLFINPKLNYWHGTIGVVEKLEDEILAERYTFIQEEADKCSAKDFPRYCAAYVNGEVKITCDKTLFGKEPGESLNEYFLLNRGLSNQLCCLVVGINEPYFLYSFEDKQPQDMGQIFTKEAWLSQYSYAWIIKELPKEKYPRVTFYLTFPVKKEHTWDYAKTIYDSGQAERIFTEEVYTSECTVKFIW